MSWYFAFRDVDLTEAQMKGRICISPIYKRPCMTMVMNNTLTCNKCKYCVTKEEAIKILTK